MVPHSLDRMRRRLARIGVSFLSCGFLLAFALTATAHGQTPSAREIQQINEVIASGVPITPEMIAVAKSRYPELRKYSNAEIQRMIEEERRGKGVSERGNFENGNEDEDGEEPDSSLTLGSPEREPSRKPVSRPGSPAASGRSSSSLTSAKIVRLLEQAKQATGTDERFPKNLKRFGHDFFLNMDEPAGSPQSPVSPDYILSAGDQIQVNTWGRENRSLTVTIDSEGMFHYPPLPPMRLAGTSFADAQRRLVSEIEKINGVSASVSLGRLRPIRVMVLGEAIRPGSFTVPAGATVSSALFRSGGVTEIGSLRAIEVRRRGKTVATLDLYEMLLKGKSQGDVQLLSGDVIFIPLAGPQVAVHGMVKRPAIYEVKNGMRALEALELAGGLQSSAHKGRLLLDRVQGNKRNVALDVDMEKPESKSNVRLENGDILLVERVLDRIEDAVWLRGNVNRPGRYQFKPGMTVRDLVPTLHDLAPETFFEYAHIQRVAPDDGRRRLLNFPLGDVFSKGLRVPLQAGDTVIVYGRYDLIARPTVSISGMVRNPGVFPFSEAMRVSDLVVLGGGLTEQAYLPEAHILRRIQDFTADTDSLYRKVIKVDLKAVVEDPAGEGNVALEPFDTLIVFPRESVVPRRTVGIYGAVRGEGDGYDLVDGMGIPELIRLAGGMTKNSYRLGVEVARRHVVGDSLLTRHVVKLNLKALLEGTETFELEDGDIVYIREVINARAFSSVVLVGEFNFPGRYEITPGERLSSVLRRAGGFTPEAYLRGAVFLRKRVRQQQIRHADEIGRRMEAQMQARLLQATQEREKAALALAIERSSQLVEQIKEAPYLGRVVIDIDRKMKFAGTEWDLELEDGDSLWVGPRMSTVSVVGEVSSPTTVIHTRKTNQVGELLSRAGGVTQFGDYKSTFYIGPDGSVTTPSTVPWYSSFKCKKVEPGGTIIVPMKPPAKDYLEIWAQSSQILYHLAVSVGVAVALF